MDVLSITIGIVLLIVAWSDLFMTVFMIGGGAGAQSGFVAAGVWRLALRMHKPGSKFSHSAMRAVGPMIVLIALATWVLEFIVGWALIFVPSVFIDSGGVSFGDRLLFSGYSIIGRSGNSPALEVDLGNWEAVHSFSGLTGVVIVSVGLAYVLPILAAIAHKRSIAATMHSLGDGVDDIYDLANTQEESLFQDHLIALVPVIELCAEQHRSYPVLHYFHSQDPHAALAPALAKVALLLKSDKTKMPKVNRTVVKPLTHSIHNLMHALSKLGLQRYAQQEKSIDNEKLDTLDIDPRTPPPTDRMPHTEWFKAYVQFDGWDWDLIKRGAKTTTDSDGNLLV